MEDSHLASKCMEFCHALVNGVHGFTFNLTLGSFSFSLDTSKKNGRPKKKHVSPSTKRRNLLRRQKFLEKKQRNGALTVNHCPCLQNLHWNCDYPPNTYFSNIPSFSTTTSSCYYSTGWCAAYPWWIPWVAHPSTCRWLQWGCLDNLINIASDLSTRWLSKWHMIFVINTVNSAFFYSAQYNY